MKREKAATTIQRVFRGYRGRLASKAYIAERKKFLELRKAEDEERQTFWYWLRNFVGVAPLLDSDTPLERVKKVYPWYMHHIVAACIENKWSDACKLMSEHDQYMKQHAIQNASMVSKWYSKLQLRWQQQTVQKNVKDIELKTTAVDNASAIYYEAQMSGAVSEGKLKKMKKQLNKLEKDKQNALDKVNEVLFFIWKSNLSVVVMPYQYYSMKRVWLNFAKQKRKSHGFMDLADCKN